MEAARIKPGVNSAHAPGRVELLGNHTDYNEGFVLSCAINHGVTARGEVLSAPRVRLLSAFAPAPVEVALEGLRPQSGDSAWANYPLGVVQVLRAEGFAVGGFEAEFSSDLPVGAGLSSSAALEVATAMLIRKLFSLTLEPLQLAKLCRLAENSFVGVNCGLLDQVSSVFGKAGHCVFLDCRTEQVDTIPFPPGLSLLVTHSGVKHALVGGEYNERRAQCFEAARLLGVPMLRDAGPELLDAARDRMPDIVYRRANHIVGENVRVLQGMELLRAGDATGFGRLMFDSHESSRTRFENSTPELDTLVAIAASISGVLGSRLTGGGFGGATVSLVTARDADGIASELAARYAEQTGHTGRCWPCLPSDGAA